MAPLRGWGPSGQRLEASAPFGHWKTSTFIAALRHDRISAPWVIDGPINGELFTLYVEKVLAPTLAAGEVVILDNHKGKPARNAIRARGAQPEERICSFCRPTAPTSIRSNRSSPSSNI
jgi:transposase